MVDHKLREVKRRYTVGEFTVTELRCRVYTNVVIVERDGWSLRVTPNSPTTYNVVVGDDDAARLLLTVGQLTTPVELNDQLLSHLGRHRVNLEFAEVALAARRRLDVTLGGI